MAVCPTDRRNFVTSSPTRALIKERGQCQARAAPSGPIQFTISSSEKWSYLYVNIRAAYGRVAIQTAILLNGGASVALLAFLSNLAIAHQAKGVTGNYATFKTAFVCFVIGVMLAASGNVIAFLIRMSRSTIQARLKAGSAGRSDQLKSERSSPRLFFSLLESRWRPAPWKIRFVRWISPLELRHALETVR